MNDWPHTASYEERSFTVVDMETVPALAASQNFSCLVEPLEPKELDNPFFSVEQAMMRISWPPITGKILENGDKVTYSGTAYELKRVFADIHREEDPYYTAYLCGARA